MKIYLKLNKNKSNENFTKNILKIFLLFIVIVIITSSLIILSSCSSVFRASITGRYIDAETEDGINDGYVFLYTSKAKFEIDWEDYQKNKDYNIFFNNSFSATTTTTSNNQTGVFTFNSIVWQTLIPDFGKDADVCDIYIVFYHEDYDASYTTQKLVSDSTTRLTPIKVIRIKNSATITGVIVDISNNNPVPNVNIKIYVPLTWTFDSNNNPIVDDNSFENKATYTTTTNANGEYSVKISYPKIPSIENDKGKTKVRIVVSITNFEASNDIDPNFTNNTSWDPDGNGIFEDYYESDTIEKDSTKYMPDLKIRRTLFNESINGIVKLSGNGVNGYKVKVIYKTTNNVITSKSTRTYTYYPNDQNTIEGYFNLDNLNLVPDNVEGTQNYQDVTIEIYDTGDLLKKTINNFRVYENSDNYIEIELP